MPDIEERDTKRCTYISMRHTSRRRGESRPGVTYLLK